jgi:hypothetical protein
MLNDGAEHLFLDLNLWVLNVKYIGLFQAFGEVRKHLLPLVMQP